MTRISITLAALFAFAAPALAESTILRVTVTSITGDTVFVDHGHDDGIRTGQMASFFLADARKVSAVVRGSLPDTARIEILENVSIPIGTHGEVAVPVATSANKRSTATTVASNRQPQTLKKETQAQKRARIETLDNAAAAFEKKVVTEAPARTKSKPRAIVQTVTTSHETPSPKKKPAATDQSPPSPAQEMARTDAAIKTAAAAGTQGVSTSPAELPAKSTAKIQSAASINKPDSPKKDVQVSNDPAPTLVQPQETAPSLPKKEQHAPSQDTLVQVTITSTTGKSVFVDRGRDNGIRPGQVARFFPPGLGEIEGVVRDASPDTARVELSDDSAVPVGTPGEITVPAGTATSQAERSKPGAPSHAPWTRKMEPQDDSVPLLAPVQRIKASERPAEIDGRVYTQFDYTWDRGDDRLAEYYYARMGVTMSATNQLGWGERFELSTQGSVRGYKQEGDEEEGGGSERDTRWRLDRLSLTLGGYEYSPYRLQLGRFYPTDVPEIGLIDGVDGTVLYPNGLRIGGSLGFLPLPSAERKTGDDFSASLYLAKQPKRGDSLSYMLAYEKTWHKGEADRDLILGRISLQPTESLWLYGSFKADIYTSGDPNRGSGIGLTQAYLQARYTPSDKYGFGLSLSHFEWPDILREEYGEPDPELIDEGHVDRAELSAWYKLKPDFRVTGRVNAWEDHRDQGYGGQIGFDWTNISRYDFSLHSSVRYTTGSFTEGLGYRLELRKNFKSIYTYLAYDRYDYETINADDLTSEYTRQTLRGGLDWRFGNWALNLSEHYEFGDNDDAFGTELYLEYRF